MTAIYNIHMLHPSWPDTHTRTLLFFQQPLSNQAFKKLTMNAPVRCTHATRRRSTGMAVLASAES